MARRDPPPKPRSDPERAFAGAVQGADVYRAIRAAVRRHDETVRLGNHFVPLASFREVAFVAVGRAAISAGFALVDALGDSLTQGFLAGPDEIPAAIPFLHRRCGSDVVGTADAGPVVAAVLELASGLTSRDLLVLALSPGSLGLLAPAPMGLGGDAYRALLERMRLSGASGPALEEFVRATGEGLAGGRLLPAVNGARVLPLVIDRGGATAAIGGGPTVPVSDSERSGARALALAHGGLGPEIARALDARPAAAAAARPVQVAGPTEVLQGAGDALSEARWWSRLAELSLAGGPEAAAATFHDRVEKVLGEVPKSRERRKGVAIFAGAPLDCVDGAGEAEALGRFLRALKSTARRRELTFAAFRTAGSRTGDGELGAGEFRADRPEIRPLSPASTGRPGVTDVGPIVLALRSEGDER